MTGDSNATDLALSLLKIFAEPATPLRTEDDDDVVIGGKLAINCPTLGVFVGVNTVNAFVSTNGELGRLDGVVAAGVAGLNETIHDKDNRKIKMFHIKQSSHQYYPIVHTYNHTNQKLYSL